MLTSQKIAIVGATGVVGQVLLKLLAEKNFPANQLILLASERSAGKTISYQNQSIPIQALAEFNFAQANIAFFATSNDISKIYVPKAAEAACWAIDKSSYFRLDPNVPLVVPEVNSELLKTTKQKIIAVPNCSTTQLVLALKPLHDLGEIERVDVATYQAVSGAGASGVKKLEQEILQPGQAWPQDDLSEAPIAFNVIPCIDDMLANGYTKEEMKMQDETVKILGAPICVNATAVRVPVWQGHSEAVTVKLKQPISLDQAREALAKFSGIHYCDQEIPTPLTHAANNTEVWVGRLRVHPMDQNDRLNFWIVSDNLYKGAAWNALQIAEILAKL